MLGFINSTNDLIVIAIVLLVLFGAKRIPELMRGLGQGMRELKRGMHEDLSSPPERSSTTDEELERRVRARLEAERQGKSLE